MPDWTVRTIILRMAHQISWHFQHPNLDDDRRYIPMVSMINSTSCQLTLSSTSPWHTADRIDFLFSGHLLMLLVSSAQLPAFSQISWFSAQNRALPKTSSTSNNSSSSRPSSRPLQSLSKTAGFWLAAILTRSERGASEVRTRSENKFWETDPLSLLTNSLVATRFRILFRTVKLKSFQRWSRAGNQAKQQLQARARRQKRRQRASKGDRGERKGRKLGKQGGSDKFERAQTVWDVGTVIAR